MGSHRCDRCLVRVANDAYWVTPDADLLCFGCASELIAQAAEQNETEACSRVPAHEAFLDAVRPRLARGAQDYGDKSFNRPFNELLVELEQEALDLAGWGFVVWEKIQRTRELAKRVDDRKWDAQGGAKE